MLVFLTRRLPGGVGCGVSGACSDFIIRVVGLSQLFLMLAVVCTVVLIGDRIEDIL